MMLYFYIFLLILYSYIYIILIFLYLYYFYIVIIFPNFSTINRTFYFDVIRFNQNSFQSKNLNGVLMFQK